MSCVYWAAYTHIALLAAWLVGCIVLWRCSCWWCRLEEQRQVIEAVKSGDLSAQDGAAKLRESDDFEVNTGAKHVHWQVKQGRIQCTERIRH